MKQYEYGFTLVNFNEMLPFSEDSFAFPIHVEQRFFFDDPSKLGWKVVLKNEPWEKRVENAKGNGPEINLLTIRNDQDFFGLQAPLPQGNEIQNDAMEFSSDENGIDEEALEITFLEDDDDFLGNSSDEE